MELGQRQTESEGGEGAVTEERVSNFGNLSWEWTRGPSSGHDGGGAGAAFVVDLLGVDDKRGSNRGNGKRSHCSCHGGGTNPAFVVGLLDVDNKRGGNRGFVTVAGWQRRGHRPGVCCQPAWH